MQRIATATWKGGPRAGEGHITTASGVMENAPYAFTSSAHNEVCTSSCELLAAAHASCMSLSLAAVLTEAGHIPQAITTEAIYTMDKVEERWSMVAVALTTSAKVPDIDKDEFDRLLARAQDLCPLSRALHPDVQVTVEAHLENAFVMTHC